MSGSWLSRMVTGNLAPLVAIALLLAGCASSASSTTPTVAAVLANPASTGVSVPSTASSASIAVRDDQKLGKILTDGAGRTLYRNMTDGNGVSHCSGSCLGAWPAFTAANVPALPGGVDGKLDLITRADGARQVTFNGSPLYYFAQDLKPGDTKGEGVGGVWHAASLTSTAAPNPDGPVSAGGY